MADKPLDVRDCPAGIALIPLPIGVLGHHRELDDEIGGKVLRFGLAALCAPEPPRPTLFGAVGGRDVTLQGDRESAVLSLPEER
jgi:hypothetical protein